MVKPNYYDEFRCIADRCKHTCCAGWEIDVDEEALARYRKMEGPLGQKLKDNIVMDEDPHFKLIGEEERCPFLNSRNLCEIILECGEESLCQICSDHPRFRNELNGEEEIGVGLCCEAAAALILGQEEKCFLTGDFDDEFLDPLEEKIFTSRQRAFEILQDRSISIEERGEHLLKEFDICLPKMSREEWVEFYLSLERMDDEWTQELEGLRDSMSAKESTIACDSMTERESTEACDSMILQESLEHLEIPFEQLFVYLVYRHLPQAQDETDIKAQLAYAYVNIKLLRFLCCNKMVCRFEDLLELARLFSSEIEYSEENTDEILNLLWEEME